MKGAVGAVTRTIAAHPVLSIVIFFAILPFLVPYRSLATQVLVYGLFALGFNLLYGYTGILSFGHAAFWGLGAYGTGITLAKLGREVAVAGDARWPRQRGARQGPSWVPSACGAAASTSPCSPWPSRRSSTSRRFTWRI